MRLSTFACFGLLVLALSSLAPQRTDAWAATCADNLLEAGCYNNVTSCHYNYSVSVCQDGAPTVSTCVEFYRDTTGCAAASGCAVNPNNNFCYKAPVACSAIVSNPTLCTYRGDCVATSATACAADVAAPKPYAYTADAVGCEDHGYLYNSFSPQAASKCFFNQTAFEAIYGTTCFAYSHYPTLTAAAACGSVTGCQYDLATDTCITAVATPVPVVAASTRNLGGTITSFSFALRWAIIAVCGLIAIVFLAYLIANPPCGSVKATSGRGGTRGRAKKPAPRSNSTSGKKPAAPSRSNSLSSVRVSGRV